MPHLSSFGITDRLRDGKARTRLSELPKVGIHLKKDLFTCVFGGESRLLLGKGSLPDLMTLLSPIPRLRGKQRAKSADILRPKFNVGRGQVACLDSDIRDVMRLLAPGR